ncbi:hypothetical protein NLI96_g6090 [Meripilus lineatus]|uniref:F-box domain-containing protein n=1 Tax=Meripilus lineatus TaxID=2056292 RepID=A0AAD5V1L1_9APHY|nr:hypothetical protein NLI96_g6090 [Physisporinus lineatus]
MVDTTRTKTRSLPAKTLPESHLRTTTPRHPIRNVLQHPPLRHQLESSYSHMRDGPLSSMPGMGLPVELWLYIIKLLRRDPITLVACALTCSTFRCPAQKQIDMHELRFRRIDSTTYRDINDLVEELSGSSKNGRRIHRLAVEGASWVWSPEVAVSVIPLRLSRRLSKLSEMHLKGITEPMSYHVSTWRLYGRAFVSVTTLDLHSTIFPSFVDFASLVTSFPALSSLSLHDVRCRNHIVPPSIAKAPSRRKLHLQFLALRWMYNDGGWFITAFSPWFFRLSEDTAGKLEIDETVTSHRSAGHILRMARTSFRSLEIRTRSLKKSSLVLLPAELKGEHHNVEWTISKGA